MPTHMTGRSARSSTPARTPAGGIHANTTTVAFPALSFERARADRATRASTRMEFSSAGSTRPSTGPDYARTRPGVPDGFASLPTNPRSFALSTRLQDPPSPPLARCHRLRLTRLLLGPRPACQVECGRIRSPHQCCSCQAAG